MNIDEAIEILNYQIKMKDTDVYTPINYDAIKTLINEYQDLKDLKDLSNELQIRYTIENMKYKDLKEIEETHRKENGKLREKIKQLEEIDKHIPRID